MPPTVSDMLLIPTQPRSLDLWAAEQMIELTTEARAVNQLLRVALVINVADAQGSDMPTPRRCCGRLPACPCSRLHHRSSQGLRQRHLGTARAVLEQTPRDPRRSMSFVAWLPLSMPASRWRPRPWHYANRPGPMQRRMANLSSIRKRSPSSRVRPTRRALPSRAESASKSTSSSTPGSLEKIDAACAKRGTHPRPGSRLPAASCSNDREIGDEITLYIRCGCVAYVPWGQGPSRHDVESAPSGAEIPDCGVRPPAAERQTRCVTGRCRMGPSDVVRAQHAPLLSRLTLDIMLLC